MTSAVEVRPLSLDRLRAPRTEAVESSARRDGLGNGTKKPGHLPPLIAPVVAHAVAHARSCKLTNLVSSVQQTRPAPSKCAWHLGTVIGVSQSERAALAWLIADAVMTHRGGASTVADLWRDAALTGTTLAGADREKVAAFISAVFGLPPDGKSKIHLVGHVAEWLWYLHSLESVATGRSIALLDAPKFNVTEPGADGFIVFSDTTTGETSFRLWEVKQHIGASAISDTVNEAYGQLNNHAMRYLAQLTNVYSVRPDAVGELCKQLVDYWIDCHERAGVGVGVASSTTSAPSRCFTTMGKQFPGFNQAGQLEGLLLAVEDLDKLALDVRGYLWIVL